MSAEAQFFRFVAGASIGAGYDLNEKKLDLSGQGSLSYALAAGKVTGSWSLPDKDGFDAFGCLRLTENARMAIKPNRECRFRIGVEAQGKVFAGASLSALVMIPSIDLGSVKKQKVAAGGSASGFAGASAEGSLGAKMEWSPDRGSKFDSLAEISGSAGGSAGAGAQGKFQIEYQNGKVRFEAGVMATLGLGGKGGASFEIGVDEAIELFAHLFYCIDWHRINSVTLLAFQFYVNATFAQFIVAKKASEYAFDKFNNFKGWLAEERRNKDSLKQSKKTINAAINDIHKLQVSPPETLGRLIQTIMITPEEDDFGAIIKILESARSAHVLKWILRNVAENPGKTDQEKGKSLEEGIRRVKGFGENLEGQKMFRAKIEDILKRNGIR